MKNQFNIEHAFPGICSICFTEVAEFRGSDRTGKPIVSRFKPNYMGLQLILNDSSVMTITVCRDCGEVLDKKDYKKLMKSEIAGWEWELTHALGNWTKEQKQYYRNVYFKKLIKDHIRPNRRKKNGNNT